MESQWTPLEMNFSLADAWLSSVRLDDISQSLSVSIVLWNEKKIGIEFLNIVYFCYQPGDYIEGIYENISGPSSLITPVRELETLPNPEYYRLISIKDIYGLDIMEIVCLTFNIKDS